MTLPFHTCSGAECPKCGVYASQPGASPRRGKARGMRPSRAAATGPQAPPAVQTFTDSRGMLVACMPDRLLPSATVILVHSHWEDGPPWQVLVHRRADNHFWGFPGGVQERGESLVACARREMLEETGLVVDILGAVALDSDPQAYALCVYDDNIVQFTNVTFLATWTTGHLRMSRESLALCWASTDALPSPFLPGHSWRLDAAIFAAAHRILIAMR